MNTKSQPINSKSGNYLEQTCLEGLSKKGKAWTKEKIKEQELSGQIFYGIIRKEALKIK